MPRKGELAAEPLKPRGCGRLAEQFATPRQGRVTVLCALLMSSAMVTSKEERTRGSKFGVMVLGLSDGTCNSERD